MSHLEVIYEGERFIGQSGEPGDPTVEQTVKALYQHADDITRMKLPLANGTWLVLPREAVRRAVFIVHP